MAAKRVATTGRFAAPDKTTDEATERDPKPVSEPEQTEKLAGAKNKAPRPAYCRVFARARMAEALPNLVQVLLTQAEKGSLAHMKLLIQLSGLDTGEVVPQRGSRKGKTLEAVLKERWAADRLEQEQDKAEQGRERDETEKGWTEKDGVGVEGGQATGNRRMDEG